jgi:hypothetical protein
MVIFMFFSSWCGELKGIKKQICDNKKKVY